MLSAHGGGSSIGGTFEKCALLAKQALTRDVTEHSPVPYVRDLEEELLEKINASGIGPGGLGGKINCPGGEYQHLSHPYRGPSRGGQYLLPCEPPCGAGSLRIRKEKNGTVQEVEDGKKDSRASRQ